MSGWSPPCVPGGRRQSIAGVWAVRMGRAVSAEIAHIGVDVGQSDGADELDVHIIDGDRFHGRILGDEPFFQLEIAEKAAQIQKVFVHGFWEWPWMVS